MSAELFQLTALPLLMSQHGVAGTYTPHESLTSRSVTALISRKQDTQLSDETEDIDQKIFAVFFTDEAMSTYGGVAQPRRGDLFQLPASEGGETYQCTGDSRLTREGMHEWEFLYFKRQTQGRR